MAGPGFPGFAKHTCGAGHALPAAPQVQQELQWQVRRTSWHPSVVIWGGNNEIEIAMGNWFQPTVDNPRLYIADYVELFLNTVEPAVAGVNPQLIFVDSSPSNGLISQDPYVKR